jgi:hypothetical protein
MKTEHTSDFRVMIRDPFWVFAYWSPEEVRRRASTAGGGNPSDQYVVRLASSEPDHGVEVAVDPEAGNWYIRVHAAFRYDCEFILRSAGGTEHTLLTAESIRMPAPSISDEVDPEWDIDDERFYRVISRTAEMFGASPMRWRSSAGQEEWAEVWWPLSPLTSSHDAQKKPSTLHLDPGA